MTQKNFTLAKLIIMNINNWARHDGKEYGHSKAFQKSESFISFLKICLSPP